MKTSALSLAVALASVGAASGTAIAASPKVKGTYAEVGETGCVTSTTLALVQLQPPPAPPQLVPISPSGFNPNTLTANGGSSLFITSAINFQPSTGSATDIVATFKYEVAADGTISTKEETVGTVVAGTRAGQTVTNDFELTGRASHNRHSIILASDIPRIETVEFSNGEVQQRICHRSRTLIKIDD